jgi:ubiquitin-protein ligase
MLTSLSISLVSFSLSAAETPFHGGCFRMKLVFGPDFPSAPPKGYFITPIFHPNVAKNGEIW